MTDAGMTECEEVANGVLLRPDSSPDARSMARLVLILVSIIREHATEHVE